jgi:hypothetical protein
MAEVLSADKVDVVRGTSYAPLMLTDDPMTPATSKEIVAARSRPAVIQEKAFARSQTRIPVAPASAVTAPIEH